MFSNEIIKLIKKHKIFTVVLIILSFNAVLLGINTFTNEDPTDVKNDITIELNNISNILESENRDSIEYSELQQQKQILELKLEHQLYKKSAIEHVESLTSSLFFWFVFLVIVAYIAHDTVVSEFEDRTIIQTLVSPIQRSRLYLCKISVNTIVAFVLWIFFIVVKSTVFYLENKQVGSLFQQTYITFNDELFIIPIVVSIIIGLSSNLIAILCIVTFSVAITFIFQKNKSFSLLFLFLILILPAFIQSLIYKYEILQYLFMNHLDLMSHLKDEFQISHITFSTSLIILFVTIFISYIFGVYTFKNKDLDM